MGPHLRQVGQIGLDPGQVGGFGPGGAQHAGVDVGTDHGNTAPGQFDGYPAGAATGVEDGAAAVSASMDSTKSASPWMFVPVAASARQRAS